MHKGAEVKSTGVVENRQDPGLRVAGNHFEHVLLPVVCDFFPTYILTPSTSFLVHVASSVRGLNPTELLFEILLIRLSICGN